MKTKQLIIYLLILPFFTLHAQMKKPHEWINYESVMGVKNGLRQYDYDIKTIFSNTPANVLWPEEKINLSFQLINNLDKQIQTTAKIYLVHYGTQGIPNDIWIPEIFKIDESLVQETTISIVPNGYMNIDLSPDVPKVMGGYAIVFDLGKYGRQLATSFVRSIKPTPVQMQYPKQSLDDLGVDFLSRVGVQAIRYGLSYHPTEFSGYQEKMRQVDEDMKKYKENNITVLAMFESGPTLMPFGTTRPHLDENGIFRRTKQDLVWSPDSDPDFKKFVQEVCRKYGWPKGPVTAVALWNEPWEGISISGWQSDMIRYREIYKAMAEGVIEARKEGADVLIGGCDSNSNAWDKFFSDGTMDMLPIFDFLSIHYQGMESPVLYPEWNNRKDHKGRVLIWDTESWVGNTDDRIGLVVAANRSTGYDRSMGIYGGYMYSGDPHNGYGKETVRTPNGTEQISPVYTTWSPAAAMGAVQYMIGERDFNELLFKNGLPWIMVFDGYNKNPDDGTVVIAGDLGESFGYENILYRGVRGLKEKEEKIQIRQKMESLPKESTEYKKLRNELETYKPLQDGKLTIKANPNFVVYDFYGNIIQPQNGLYQIPLTYKGYYIRTNGKKGTFNQLLSSLKSSRIEGYEPVEVIAKDFTSPIQEHPEMKLVLTNILNRSISGTLQVTMDNLQISYPAEISFKPNETKTIKVKVSSGNANSSNTYPATIYFNAGKDGIATHWEDMHVNYIYRKSITVDGNLDEWQEAIPQTIKSSGASSISLTEAAWFPFQKFDTNAEGFSNAYLAYDDQYFYFAAKVADKTPNAGTMKFENRNDDTFFYPEKSYKQTIRAMHAVEIKTNPRADNQEALQQPEGNGRMLNYIENTETTQSIGVSLDLPSDTYTRTSLFFPNVNQQRMEIVVSDSETGQDLLTQQIEKVWNGAYLTLDLAGKVTIRCSTLGWWYTAKLGGIFFDKAGNNQDGKASAQMVAKDFDTKGNWKPVYGKSGYHIIGIPSSLPEGISCQIIEADDLIELKWPKGVRNFTYRTRPVLPDATANQPSDNILIAFNVLPIGEDGMEANPKGTMPGYTGYKCTDYEYALNTVAPQYGGGFEIWRMLVPGMPRKHFYPRQPKSGSDGPVRDGKLIARREGNTLYTECAIPWNEIPDVKKALDKGEKIKFSYRVNDDGAGGACMELARKRSVSKKNSRAFHPDWKEHWANEVEFGFEK